MEADDAGRDGMTMFEQRDRWLEELRDVTDRKESLTCASGHMPLTAITQEIAAAAADGRQHGRQQVPSWVSMASDLDDTLGWIGPSLLGLVGSAGHAIHDAIMGDLLVTGSGGGRNIDDLKRPVVAARAGVLIGLLDGDDLIVAAWRDLVAACRDVDHSRYPSERVVFLRDSLIGLIEHRNQDRGHWSPISTAVQVLLGSPASVQQAQEMVGDEVDGLYDLDAPVSLTDSQLADLAERCLVKQPLTGSYVIWFRISPAFILGASPCVVHGEVTFYDAQDLASALTDHDRARALEVVPEELITDEIRELQLSADIDDCTGFEFMPQLVYARVSVSGVERHRATDAARTLLDAVLAVVGVPDGMWTVLDGTLFFDGGPSYFAASARWGLKEPLPDPVFYQNDHVERGLRDMAANGHVISAEASQQLQPALRLFNALINTPRTDAEAVVMAAVRSIEHCNTWVAPLGGLHWNAFIDEYLIDEYTISAFSKRVVLDVFAGVVQYLPDRTPGAKHPPELSAIRQDVTVSGLGTTIDSTKTISHVGALRRIYANHWLVRRLAETDDTMSSPVGLAAAFDVERDRVSKRIKRLTRSRNAAIHGGPLSDAACSTIADIAVALARQALSTAIMAIVTGELSHTRATNRRDDFRRRIRNLQQGGDLANLFKLTP